MKTLKISLVILLVGLITAFTLKNTSDGYGIGDSATDFNLKNVDNNMVSLANFEDAKGFIVIFTCNTCPYSVAYEDRIIELDKKHKEKGYPVIAINPNNPQVKKGDSFELMQQRAKDKGYTFPYLLDEGQHIYPQYGTTRTPHVYLLNKDNGAIDNNFHDASAVTEKYVENAVEALLSEKNLR